MNAARSFRDLRVYQLARTAAREVFEASKGFRARGAIRGTVMEGPLSIDEMLFDGLDDQQETNA
jgi:hypothetical protein